MPVCNPNLAVCIENLSREKSHRLWPEMIGTQHTAHFHKLSTASPIFSKYFWSCKNSEVKIIYRNGTRNFEFQNFKISKLGPDGAGVGNPTVREDIEAEYDVSIEVGGLYCVTEVLR